MPKNTKKKCIRPRALLSCVRFVTSSTLKVTNQAILSYTQSLLIMSDASIREGGLKDDEEPRASVDKSGDSELESVFRAMKLPPDSEEDEGGECSFAEDEESVEKIIGGLPSPNSFTSYDALKTFTIGQIFRVGLCDSLKTEHLDAYLYFRALFQRLKISISKDFQRCLVTSAC
jgi:hypothetical protein